MLFSDLGRGKWKLVLTKALSKKYCHTISGWKNAQVEPEQLKY